MRQVRYEQDGVTVDGTRYETISEAAHALGVDASWLAEALDEGEGETSVE